MRADVQPAVIDGLEFRFNRRRYGRTFYCWAAVKLPDDTFKDLGDPWPAANWPKVALLQEARRAIARAVPQPCTVDQGRMPCDRNPCECVAMVGGAS